MVSSAAGGMAAASVFALQSQAEAAVVYVDPADINTTIGAGFAFALGNLNIDGTGLHEFNVAVHRYMYTSGYVYGLARLGIAYAPGGLLRNASGQVKKLASGAVVSSGQLFNTSGVLRKFLNGAPIAGTWASNATGFAGIQFQIGANTHYGWIRLKWTDSADAGPDPNTVTVMDWAYNNTPNASILAGDTGAVPEPGRALLALAGAGAAFLRRRRKTN